MNIPAPFRGSAAAVPSILFALFIGAPLPGFELRKPVPEGIRPLPFLAGEPATVVRAEDFGARPDDGKDDAPAIRKAIAAARGRDGLVEIRFSPGRYDLVEAEADVPAFFRIEDARDLLLEATGAEWIARNPRAGIFRIENSERVEVRGASIDYDPLPWTEGTVVAADPGKGTLDLRVRPGFPRPDADYFTDSVFWGYALDPVVPGRLKFGAPSHSQFVPPAVPVEENVFRLSFAEPHREHAAKSEKGDRFALLARRGGAYTAFCLDSRQITFRDVETYAAVSGHYVTVRTDALNVLGCRALIRDGRWKGGNADAIHVQTARIGPWVEDCHFEGISDDSLVVYTRPYAVESIDGPGEMRLTRVSHGGKKRLPIPGRELQPGDRLDFFDPNADAGHVLATATVAEFDPATGRVELTEAFPAPEALRQAGPEPVQVFNRAHGRGYVMRGNLVRNSRRYGLYVKAGNGLVSGNWFEGLSSNAIAVFNEPSAPNGGFAHDLVLSGNWIVDCGFSEQYLAKPGNAAFSVYAKRFPFRPSEEGTAHGPILVRDNRVLGWLYRPYSLGNIDGLRAEGNRWGPGRIRPGFPPDGSPFHLVSNRNVTVRDNLPLPDDPPPDRP